MQDDSILKREFIEMVLATAKKNLEKDGWLQPVLFLQFTGGQRAVCPLGLPKVSDAKQAYFAALGASLHQAGKAIHEAAFLSESWFVEAQKAVSALDFAPSRHPQRQEAIVVIGRDAGRQRVSSVVQPFTRQAENRPVWGELVIATYNNAVETGWHPVGLLHYLFNANQERG
jgi:hypothetical protein